MNLTKSSLGLRITLGFGIALATNLVFAFVFYSMSIGVMAHADAVATVAEPLDEAADEIEINTHEMAVSVLAYLYDHDPRHLKLLAQDKQSAADAIARYRQLAPPEHQGDRRNLNHGSDCERLLADFSARADELVRAADRTAEARKRLAESAPGREPAGATGAFQQVLLQAERAQVRNQLASKELDELVQRIDADPGLSEEGKAEVRAWAAVAAETVAATQAERRLRTEFMTAHSRLHDFLDDGMQVHSGRRLDVALAESRGRSGTMLTTLPLIVLAQVLLLAVLVWGLRRMIVRPLAQLAEASAAVWADAPFRHLLPTVGGTLGDIAATLDHLANTRAKRHTELERDTATRETVKTLVDEIRTAARAAPAEPVTVADVPQGDYRRAGPYRLGRVIGSGGSGVVYEARQPALGRSVAVKVLSRAVEDNEVVRARFEREALAVGRLDHPNIIRAIDAGITHGRMFLAMEYVDGPDLGRVIRTVGSLSVADGCAIAVQVLAALRYAHAAGFVHRDLTPGNILLTTSGVAKITDFGLALATDSGERLSANLAVGTPAYLAPELVGRGSGVDFRADFYSLGCVLYHTLTGRLPFQGVDFNTPYQMVMAHATLAPPPVREVRPDLPRALADMIDRLLEKEPASRPCSLEECDDILAGLATGSDLAAIVTAIGPEPASGAVELFVTHMTGIRCAIGDSPFGNPQ